MATLGAGTSNTQRERRRSSVLAKETEDGPTSSYARSGAEVPKPIKNRKTFVLCFDGTGNKFSGTDADSNILKIYRMLDRVRIFSL